MIGTAIETGVIILCGLVVYTYAGYPVVLWVGVLLRGRKPAPPFVFPAVTLIIPAHNEERCIGGCLTAVFSSDYPRSQLQVLVVSDASTDGTDAIVESFLREGVSLLALPKRVGKDSALVRALDATDGQLLMIMDASSVVKTDTFKRLVRHFQDPTIGSAVAAKTILRTEGTVSQGDGLYWRYDSMLRTLESLNGSSWVGVEGGLFAIRRQLFRMDLGKGLSLDLALGGRLCAGGRRNFYDSTALVWERASQHMGAEFRRKIRVIVRGVRAFFYNWRLFNPIRRPGFVFQNFSHKLLRWLVPFFLLGIFFGCLVADHPALRLLLAVQSAFYLVAALGLLFRRLAAASALFSVPAYFCTVNAAALLAWFLAMRRFDIWEPTLRHEKSTHRRSEQVAKRATMPSTVTTAAAGRNPVCVGSARTPEK